MEPFATKDDYIIWHGAVADEERLEALLEAAAEFLTSELARFGKAVDADDGSQAATLKRVSIRLVHDFMGSGDVMPGVSQTSMTAGPFSNSFTFASQTGAFRLLPSELKHLCLGGGRIGSVPPRVHE